MDSHCNCKAYEYDGFCEHTQQQDRAQALKMRVLVNQIDVQDQSQIDQLKKDHPGEGVGPYVQEKLTKLIEDGVITNPESLPSEYRKYLSHLIS
tara:strand:- start:97142 stop:97423 length:282 start_codon:yes stop_codon:yes gene_type:complete